MTTTISDVFRSITILYGDLIIFPTEPKTNARNSQIQSTSLNFIQYLHKKSLCKELLPILILQKYEIEIVTVIATGKLLMDNNNTGINLLSNSVKQIQSILLNLIPLESEEYQKLLVDIPDLKKFTPQIG